MLIHYFVSFIVLEYEVESHIVCVNDRGVCVSHVDGSKDLYGKICFCGSVHKQCQVTRSVVCKDESRE